MDPLTVSAQFAAYMWFTRRENSSAISRTAAMQFAQAHWEAFLPIADKGVGRLLLRLAKGPREVKHAPANVVATSPGAALRPPSRSGQPVSERFSMN